MIGPVSKLSVRPSTLSVLFLLINFSLHACGGGGTSTAPVLITVSPEIASVTTGGSQTFAAAVTGNPDTAVTWAVQEAAGGTISNDGTYTAPNTEGIFHVTATSNADPTQSAMATVTVMAAPVVSVAISPTAVTLSLGGSRTFTATVSGSSNTAVTWGVQETGGGSIASDGTYTAPNTEGIFHVIATSQADPTKSATATVTVTASPGIPTGVSAVPGNMQVTLSWAAVSGATSYNVYMATVSGVTPANYAGLAGGMQQTNVTSPFTHTGLSNFTPYYFVVTSVNAGGESGPSAEVSAKPLPLIIARVSVDSSGAEATLSSSSSSISSDGRYVAFESTATNLVTGDGNGFRDIFVHDRQIGATTRVSVDSNGAEAGGGSSGSPSISADGRYVAFESTATNLVTGDGNGFRDIFVRDTCAGATGCTPNTIRVSVASNGIEANSSSSRPSVSADGRYVAFESTATNLVTGDGNGFRDIFVHDRQIGATTRLSVDSNGTEAGGGSSGSPSISADGRYVAFESTATNLVTGDANGFGDIFVHDRQTGTTTRLSVNSFGVEANSSSSRSSISGDGRYVAFESTADNLVTGDTNATFDIFVAPVP